jgi:site-specific recombinase XerD
MLVRVFNSYLLNQFLKQKKHWQQFYLKFTDYLYDDCGNFDNYVGAMIKLLKSFCHWVETEKGINMGAYYKSFHPPKEDIPIIVLQPEQLNFLINNKQFDAKLPAYLRNTKDFFVFGCTVGLRVSDMKALKKSNLEIADSTWYLKVHSKKTNTFTKIKLPQYAIDLIVRNRSRGSSGRSSVLFPAKSLVNFLG